MNLTARVNNAYLSAKTFVMCLYSKVFFEKLNIRQNSWLNYLNWSAFHVSSKCLLQSIFLFSSN